MLSKAEASFFIVQIGINHCINHLIQLVESLYNKEKIYLCPRKIMTIQRAHISLNLCDRPIVKGLFGYECMILNEVKCAYFENYLL